MFRPRHIARLAITTALLAAAAALAGSAIATVAAESKIYAKGAKKTTVVRSDEIFTTSSVAWIDVPGMSGTISFEKESILLADFTGESACYDDGAPPSWCAIRIVVDPGVGELLPAAGTGYAFDSTDDDAEGVGSWEGHALQRSSNPLPGGVYTVRVQAAVNGDATFRLDDMHLTIEAIQL